MGVSTPIPSIPFLPALCFTLLPRLPVTKLIEITVAYLSVEDLVYIAYL